MGDRKWVYDFAEGSKDMRELLGGKGANVAEMTRVLGADKVRRAKVIVRPVHCELHAAPPIAVAKAEPTPEAAHALMDEAWTAVTEMWLAAGGSPEPGQKQRPALKERVKQRLPERLQRVVR